MANMAPFLLLLWVGVTVSTELDLQKRIVNGHDCDRPYHVKLLKDNKKFICGGSLISKQWILTASHCWKVGWKLHAVLNGKSMPITETPTMFWEGNKEHDLLLLKLPSSVQVKHVNLPTCGESLSKVQIAGHTMKRPGQTECVESPTLQCVDMDVVKCGDMRNCLKMPENQEMRTYITQHWFCGKTHNVDICGGDSGGGAVHDNMIYGVIVFGGEESDCSLPAAFMDLCQDKYLDWIKKEINAP